MNLFDSIVTFLTHWGLLVGLLGFLALFIVRVQWALAHLEMYTLNASYFCVKTKQPISVRQEMGEVWPKEWMLFELWRWDWKRYIIHHDHFYAMTAFIQRELARPHLSMLEMARDVVDGIESKKADSATKEAP